MDTAAAGGGEGWRTGGGGGGNNNHPNDSSVSGSDGGSVGGGGHDGDDDEQKQQEEETPVGEPGDEPIMDNLTRLRREKRLAMNRVSARKRRRRTKTRQAELEQQVARLNQSARAQELVNQRLSARVNQLNADLQQAHSHISLLTRQQRSGSPQSLLTQLAASRELTTSSVVSQDPLQRLLLAQRQSLAQQSGLAATTTTGALTSTLASSALSQHQSPPLASAAQPQTTSESALLRAITQRQASPEGSTAAQAQTSRESALLRALTQASPEGSTARPDESALLRALRAQGGRSEAATLTSAFDIPTNVARQQQEHPAEASQLARAASLQASRAHGFLPHGLQTPEMTALADRQRLAAALLQEQQHQQQAMSRIGFGTDSAAGGRGGLSASLGDALSSSDARVPSQPQRFAKQEQGTTSVGSPGKKKAPPPPPAVQAGSTPPQDQKEDPIVESGGGDDYSSRLFSAALANAVNQSRARTAANSQIIAELLKRESSKDDNRKQPGGGPK